MSQHGAVIGPNKLLFLMAIMLLASLMSCEQKPAPGNASPQVQQPASKVEKKADQARSAKNEPSVETHKDDSNALLAAKVKSVLTAEPGLKDLAIDVSASDGNVELFGTVDTPENRIRAAQIASKVPGVKAVKNYLVLLKGS